jgi:NitT/TauT family transport system substrate-binding protein
MTNEQASRFGRREFLGGLTLAGTAGLLGVRPGPAAAEPPPETTKLRVTRSLSICQAPQYIAEALFEAEGFTDVQFVGETAIQEKALVSGDAQIGMLFVGPLLLRLDDGAPVAILSGGHVGCIELFGHEPVRFGT